MPKLILAASARTLFFFPSPPSFQNFCNSTHVMTSFPSRFETSGGEALCLFVLSIWTPWNVTQEHIVDFASLVPLSKIRQTSIMFRAGILHKVHLLHQRPSGSLHQCLTPRTKLLYQPLSCNAILRQKARASPQSLGGSTPSKADSAENIKPEGVQRPPDVKSDGAPKTDGLLTEQTVSNKEQRKADWAIMKEMVQYLWPKVELRRRRSLRDTPDRYSGRYRHQSQSQYCYGSTGWL
jgi:hypothetical protein